MRKNGHDRNGRQRWQCDACKATTTASAEARGRAAVVRPGEHERWKGMLAERTNAKDHPDDPKAATSRSGWWWTHLPLRRAYFRLERLFNDGTLFCLFDPTLSAHSPVPRDSDRLEGGLNAALKRMLVNHRGLPEAHMRRACEWHCYMHSAKPDPAHILKQHDQNTKTGTNHDNNDEPMSQPTLGTGIDWNEFHTATRYPDTTD